jgi:D-threo-aldose 1-dehydrogenase
MLDDLRSQGVIKAVGVGMNQWQVLADFARAGDFDCFLLAGRYTLLEQESLEGLLTVCVEKDVRIVVGGPYNSGILVTGPVDGAYYNYAPAPPHVVERVAMIQAVCDRHGVNLPAAALQFPLAHPAIACVIPGGRTRAEVEANAGLLEEQIPAEFWAELKGEGLVDAEAPLPA